MTSFWSKLKKPIIGLSPMDGITDYFMREIQAKIAKPDVIYTEFVNVDGLLHQPEKFVQKIQFSEKERPVIIQLFGSNPQSFYWAIKIIKKLGFDGIDLNLGCPSKKIIEQNAGAGLIGNYQLVKEIIMASLKSLKEFQPNIPLSVKTRIGREKIITKEWFTFLSGFPLCEVTIHGRLASQNLSGPVNWLEIEKGAEILQKRKIIVLGNGGIKSLEEGRVICQKFNLDGILIGQAALGNPWFFKENYQPLEKEVLETALAHLRLVKNFPQDKNYLSVKKHLNWYLKKFYQNKQFRIKLLTLNNIGDLEEEIIREIKRRESES